MGYLIDYKYYPEKSRGDYDKDKITSATLSVGSAEETIPLDVLASKIVSLLARRSMLITDISISLVETRKINFKEEEDGIILGDTKFGFDSVPLSKVSEVKTSVVQQEVAKVPIQQPVAPVQPPQQSADVPLRYEFFLYDPKDETQKLFYDLSRKSGDFHFTNKKRYPILKEKRSEIALRGVAAVMYLTIDDNGKRVSVSEHLFSPIPNAASEDGEIRLDWQGATRDNVKLR